MVSVGIAVSERRKRLSVDCRDAVQALVGPNQESDAALRSRQRRASCWRRKGDAGSDGIDSRSRFAGDHLLLRRISPAATNFVRSDDAAAAPIEITRASCVPANRIEAFFKNPFANLDGRADRAAEDSRRRSSGSVPEAGHGWLVALGLYVFMAFYAHGAGRGGVAGAERADADAHPLERHEHRAGASISWFRRRWPRSFCPS